MSSLPAEFRKELSAALLQIPALAGAEGRNLLLLDMPGTLPIVRSDNQAIDLAAIVGAVGDLETLPDGTPALAVLLENALALDPPAAVAARLQALLAAVQRGVAGMESLAVEALPDQNERIADPSMPPSMVPETATPPPQPAPPSPPVDNATHFRFLIEAVSRGDWQAVLDLGQALPADYPGVAPILQRARDAQQQRQDLYNAIHDAFTKQEWALVSRLSADLPTTDPIVSPMVAEARKRLATSTAGSPEQIYLNIDAGDHDHPARHTGAVTAVGWAPDGKYYASASSDGTVSIWSPDRATPVRVLRGDGGDLSCLAWSPDGDCVAAAGKGGLILQWDLKDGTLRGELFAHTEWVRALAWAPTPGALLASGDDSGLILVWNWPDAQLISTLKGHTGAILGLAWAPDQAARLVSGSWDATLRLWDTQEQRALSTQRNLGAGVHCVAWGTPGIASGSNDKQVRIWDAGLTHLVRTLNRDGEDAPAAARAYKGGAYTTPAHDGEVTSVAWRADGSLLASGASDYTIRIWDTRTWMPLLTLTGHQAAVNAVAWSPNGTMLVSGADDATVRLWRIDLK